MDRPDLTPSALWRAAIEERRRACGGAAAGFRVMLVPDRATVCEDPGSPGRGRAAGALADLLIDPGPGLRARMRLADTYLRTGSGWTDYGAYAASRELIEDVRERLNVAPAPEAGLEFWEEEQVGDLALAAEPPDCADPKPETVLQVLAAWQDGHRRVFGRSNRDGGSVQAFEHPDSSLPSALVFASRGPAGAALTRMLPFLCARFSRLVAVAAADLFLDLMESERPDVVVALVSERELAAAPPPMRRDFEAWSGVRLPLPASTRDVVVDFAAAGNAEPALREGWSGAEPEHRWSVGPASTLVISGPLRACAHELSIELCPCVVPPAVPRQRFGIEACGTQVGAFDLDGPARITVEVPADAVAAGRDLALRFLHPDFVTPAELGPDADDRPLAFCFGRLELRPKPAA